MAQPEANHFRIREVATLEKFEVEDGGRRLIETIRLENGVIVSVERPPTLLPEGGAHGVTSDRA